VKVRGNLVRLDGNWRAVPEGTTNCRCSFDIPYSNRLVFGSGRGDDIAAIGRARNRPHPVSMPLEGYTNRNSGIHIPNSHALTAESNESQTAPKLDSDREETHRWPVCCNGPEIASHPCTDSSEKTCCQHAFGLDLLYSTTLDLPQTGRLPKGPPMRSY
jgi:hypothetical protein